MDIQKAQRNTTWLLFSLMIGRSTLRYLRHSIYSIHHNNNSPTFILNLLGSSTRHQGIGHTCKVSKFHTCQVSKFRLQSPVYNISIIVTFFAFSPKPASCRLLPWFHMQTIKIFSIYLWYTAVFCGLSHCILIFSI